MEHNFNAPFKFMVLDDKNVVRQTVFANDPTITIQDNWIEMPADTDFDPINKVYDAKTKTFSDAQKTVDDKIIKALKKKVNIASEVMGDTIQNWI